MTDPTDTPPAAPDAPPSTALVSTPTSKTPDPCPVQAEMDAHGYDPDEYHWVPVLRKPRSDGWSPHRQRTFIAALADTGSVQAAAEEADMSPHSCYRFRRSPGGENFAVAWDAAIQQASLKLIDVAFERAINGVAERVEYDESGAPMEPRRRYNDRLLMFLLRAHRPERYRFANHDARLAKEPVAPLVEPLPDAMARLSPATPDRPYLRTHNGDVIGAMQVADLGDGSLPSYYRDGPGDFEPGEFPMGIEFERELAKAKRHNPAASYTKMPEDGDSLV